MEDYSHDELEAPEWLNKDFIEEILQSIENNKNIKVVKYEITPAVAKGNHFVSIMFRAYIDYCINDSKTKIESLLVKAKPEKEGAKKDLCKDDRIFETEIQMFAKTLPYFEKVFKDNGINIQFGAKMFYNVGNNIIVLEDLKKLDYTILSASWINYDAYKLALNKLAKWHAVSYKIFHEDDPQIVKYYEDRGVMKLLDIENNLIFTDGIHIFTNVLNGLSDIDEIYKEKFSIIKDKLVKECINIHASANGKFNVLNHGDFHSRNMLFKKDNNGKIIDVLFVDFQMCFWGSPAADIIYSLYMLADPEIRQNRRDEVLYFYYTSFVDTLKELKFSKSIPTYEDLQAEMNRMKKFELFLFTSIIPYLYEMDSGVRYDEELFDNEKLRTAPFEAPAYLKDMKITLPYMLHNGYLFSYNN